MSGDPALHELKALSRLITRSIESIESTLGSRGEAFPRADEPFAMQTEACRMAPDILQACGVVSSAAAQLIACVRPAGLSLLVTAQQYQVTSAMHTAIRLHVPDILRPVGAKGLHVNQIAAPTGVDPSKLARILRVLVTDHIFVEVTPDVFAHNRISSLLVTGKSVEEIINNPTCKHDNTSGIPALMEFLAGIHFKSSAYMYESLTATDPKLGDNIGFNVAYQTPVPIFDWLAQPDQVYSQKLFDRAMDGKSALQPPGQVVSGLAEFSELDAGSMIVDVGGGVGSATLELVKAYPHLKFVVQDQQGTISAAERFWKARMPEALTSGQVKLQVHNFLDKQPISDPAVFYIQAVLHDWSDEICLAILRHLRSAAGDKTRLVISEQISAYACDDPLFDEQIPGADRLPVPAPLLPNGGHASIAHYFRDLAMMNAHNGKERTLSQAKTLLEAAGWKIIRVHLVKHFMSKVIAVPS